MLRFEKGRSGKTHRREHSQVILSLEDRFRFSMILIFSALATVSLAFVHYVSRLQYTKIKAEAASSAVQRWYSSANPGLEELLIPKATNDKERAPAILEPNRKIHQSLMPQELTQAEISFSQQNNGEVLWIINKHPLLENNVSVVLHEQNHPELRIAREYSYLPDRMSIIIILTLTVGWVAIFYFERKFVFRPVQMIRDSLLSRHFTEVLRIRRRHHSKITIEQLEEQSRFPLSQLENDEFGQIALILEEQDRRHKTLNDQWLNTFNTINEPIAIFTQTGLVRTINQTMAHLINEIGHGNSNFDNIQAQKFMTEVLSFDDKMVSILNNILKQQHPKIHKIQVSLNTSESLKKYHCSIATIINHGELFAVLTMISDNSNINAIHIDDSFADFSHSQLKIIHRIQSTLRGKNDLSLEPLQNLCESLIDHTHHLIEITRPTPASKRLNDIEFNVFQFFKNIQSASEGIVENCLKIDKSVPNFITGDPTHLRQVIKGIFQFCYDTHPRTTISTNVSYEALSKKMCVSITTVDGTQALRDATMQLFLSHYSQFFSMQYASIEELREDEFVRFYVNAQPGITRIDPMSIDLSNRRLPKSLLIISDTPYHPELASILNSVPQINCEWIQSSAIFEREFSKNQDECLLYFLSSSQNIAEYRVKQIMQHVNSKQIPSILAIEKPKRGESLTALRLGFAAFLTFPIANEEIHKLLILTMNRHVRESIKNHGLITKHTVREFFPSLGQFLLGDFSKDYQSDAKTLQETLSRIGFNVHIASTVHNFFEKLHQNSFEFVAYPDDISTGLRRRIQISCRDTPYIAFGQSAASDKSEMVSERENPSKVLYETSKSMSVLRKNKSCESSPDKSEEHIKIIDIDSPEKVKKTLKRAMNKDKALRKNQSPQADEINQTPGDLEKTSSI
jgi:hypothetical protein